MTPLRQGEGHSLGESLLWVWGLLLLLFTPKQISFSIPLSSDLLIITSILDLKWRMNSSTIQVTFRVLWLFEGCQTSVFHLKNQQSPCTKGEQDRIRENGLQGSERKPSEDCEVSLLSHFHLGLLWGKRTCTSYRIDKYASVVHPKPEKENSKQADYLL